MAFGTTVEFKRVFNEYPGSYLFKLSPGVYLVGDEDDIIIVSKGDTAKAISLKTFYHYDENNWFTKVRRLDKGNTVTITGE